MFRLGYEFPDDLVDELIASMQEQLDICLDEALKRGDAYIAVSIERTGERMVLHTRGYDDRPDVDQIEAFGNGCHVSLYDLVDARRELSH